MAQSPERSKRIRDSGFAALAVAAVAITSVVGQIATNPNLVPWYARLAKPAFNPPNWVFAPVWTILYALMAFALWRILRLSGSDARRRAVLLFFILLFFNAAWSWMFFWAQSPLLGLLNIVPQFAVILVTIALFVRLDSVAAICLFPLAAWVAFAGVLNLAIWRLNG
jgi:tryptophan-rich sensory protein